MNLLALEQLSISVVNHTFILVSWVCSPHLPTSHLNQAVGIIPVWTNQWRTLSMV